MLTFDHEQSIQELVNLYKKIDDNYKINSEVFDKQNEWEKVKFEISTIAKEKNLKLSFIQLELYFQYIIFEANMKAEHHYDVLKNYAKQTLQTEICDSINYYLDNYKKKKLIVPKNIQSFLDKNNLNINDIFLIAFKDLEKLDFNTGDISFLKKFSEKHKINFSAKKNIFELLNTKKAFLNLSLKTQEVLTNLNDHNIKIEDLHHFNFNYVHLRKWFNTSNLGTKTLLELKDFLNNNFIKIQDDLILFLSNQNFSNTVSNIDYSKPLKFLPKQLELDTKSDGLHLSNFQELSDKKLSILLSDIKFLRLSVRSNNCLKTFGIKKIGEIIYYGLDRLQFMPNMGKKSVKEIISSIDKVCDFDFRSIFFDDWPSSEIIHDIISSRKIKINQFNKISFKGLYTIEEELIAILSKITDGKKLELIKKRYGLSNDQVNYTLQELGDLAILGKKVTRERIRQVINAQIKKISLYNFELPKLELLKNYVIKNKFVSENDIFEFCIKENISQYNQPSKLIEISNFMKLNNLNDIEKCKILSVNETYFCIKQYSNILEPFFNEILVKLTGSIFFRLDQHSLIQSNQLSINEGYKILSSCKNLVILNENDNFFVFKELFHLDVSKNALSVLLGKVFNIVKKVDLNFLYNGLMKVSARGNNRRQLNKNDFSFDLFKSYISKLEFFKLDNNYLTINSKPIINHLTEKEDKLILKYFLEYGRDVDTKTFVNQMTKNGISSNQARVIYHTSIFLVQIKKGYYSNKGYSKFIFEKDFLYSDNLEEIYREIEKKYDETKTVNFENDIKLKMQGIVKIPQLNISDNNYKIFDENSNFQFNAKVKNNIIYGFERFAKNNDNESFELTFIENQNYFVIK